MTLSLLKLFYPLEERHVYRNFVSDMQSKVALVPSSEEGRFHAAVAWAGDYNIYTTIVKKFIERKELRYVLLY